MLIKVRVKTAAKKEGILQKSDGRLEIALKEKPERNEANKKLVKVVGAHFGVPVGTVKIVSGHKRPSKIVSVGERGAQK